MRLHERDRRNAERLRILGIDPGSRICGYGIIEHEADRESGNGYRYVSSGRIELSPRDPLHVRLNDIHAAISDIIREHKPHEVVIERVFFAKSVKAALQLGHVRGVSMLAAASQGLQVYEYTALQVKKAVVGYGRAEKSQMQAMVQALLDLKKALSPDSADALALSICHLNSMRFESLSENGPRSFVPDLKRKSTRHPAANYKRRAGHR